jgi:hypothetical protein
MCGITVRGVHMGLWLWSCMDLDGYFAYILLGGGIYLIREVQF